MIRHELLERVKARCDELARDPLAMSEYIGAMIPQLTRSELRALQTWMDARAREHFAAAEAKLDEALPPEMPAERRRSIFAGAYAMYEGAVRWLKEQRTN